MNCLSLSLSLFLSCSMKDVLVLFPSSRDRCAKWQPTYWPRRFFQRSFLRQGDLHNYRFFLNQQPIRLDSLPAEPLNNLVPDFRTEIDPAVDPKGFALATFMHQNGFLSITEQLGRHWKPVALAFDWDQGCLGGPTFVQSVAIRDHQDPLADSERNLNEVDDRLGILEVAPKPDVPSFLFFHGICPWKPRVRSGCTP